MTSDDEDTPKISAEDVKRINKLRDGIDRTPQGLRTLLNDMEEIKNRLSKIEDKLDELMSKHT